MIYISSILGGPELEGSRIDTAIKRVLSRRPPGEEGNYGSLDVVFHIPGSIVKPEYHGLRTAKFSSKEKMLMVQVSVPPDVVMSDEAEAFVIQSLKEAIRIARPRFERAGIPYPEDEYLSDVDGMAAGLVH